MPNWESVLALGFVGIDTKSEAKPRVGCCRNCWQIMNIHQIITLDDSSARLREMTRPRWCESGLVGSNPTPNIDHTVQKREVREYASSHQPRRFPAETSKRPCEMPVPRAQSFSPESRNVLPRILRSSARVANVPHHRRSAPRKCVKAVPSGFQSKPAEGVDQRAGGKDRASAHHIDEYRRCTGICLVNRQGLVFAAR
jgi:hypothetical protein